MFRTRLAALVLTGGLCFAGGCMGISNPFCGRFGCSAPPAAPCYGCGDSLGSSPIMDGPPLYPQPGVLEPGGAVIVQPQFTQPQMQMPPQAPPMPAPPSNLPVGSPSSTPR